MKGSPSSGLVWDKPMAALRVVDSCTGWHLLAKSLQWHAAGWLLLFDFKPTGSIHTPAVADPSTWSLLNSGHGAKRGARSA